MTNILEFRPRPHGQFGTCPKCGRDPDECRNIGRDHWGLCRQHKQAWWFGSNIFSSWHDESPDDWRRNAAELAGYEGFRP